MTQLLQCSYCGALYDGRVSLTHQCAQPRHATAVQLLEQAAKTFAERNKVYGNNYKPAHFGAVMNAIFPLGMMLDSAEDWAKIGILVQVVAKLTRYAAQWPAGHKDSAHDMIVYSAMLEELTK